MNNDDLQMVKMMKAMMAMQRLSQRGSVKGAGSHPTPWRSHTVAAGHPVAAAWTSCRK